MSTRKKFTPDEIRHLKANPYTQHVTESTITYTLAFKEAFWQLSLEGYTGPAAFRKLGYNTEVLGFDRIHNTSKRLRKPAQTVEGRVTDLKPVRRPLQTRIIFLPSKNSVS